MILKKIFYICLVICFSLLSCSKEKSVYNILKSKIEIDMQSTPFAKQGFNVLKNNKVSGKKEVNNIINSILSSLKTLSNAGFKISRIKRDSLHVTKYTFKDKSSIINYILIYEFKTKKQNKEFSFYEFEIKLRKYKKLVKYFSIDNNLRSVIYKNVKIITLYESAFSGLSDARAVYYESKKRIKVMLMLL